MTRSKFEFQVQGEVEPFIVWAVDKAEADTKFALIRAAYGRRMQEISGAGVLNNRVFNGADI